MMSTPSMKRPLPETDTFMPGSPLQNRLPIWSVKSNLCEPNSPDTKLYRKLVQGSTLNAKGCSEFWSPQLKEMSQKLSWPTEIDLEESELTSSNGFSIPMELNSSWFNVTTMRSQMTSSPKIYFPSYSHSVPVLMEEEATNPKKKRKKGEGKVIRSRKVAVKLSKGDPDLLKRMFGCHRWIYNEILKKSNHKDFPRKITLDVKSLYRKILTAEKEFREKTPWLSEYPSYGRQSAIDEFFKNLQTNKMRTKNKWIKHFTMKQKSKRDDTQIIKFEHYTFDGSKFIIPDGKRGTLEFIPRKSGVKGLNPHEKIRREITLQRQRDGRFYIIITEDRNQQFKGTSGVVALDPGGATFQTTYDDFGLSVKIGDWKDSKILNILEKADSYQKTIDDFKTKEDLKKKRSLLIQKLRQRFQRCHKSVKSKVSEIHNKTINWLTSNYRMILLPQFNSKQMVASEDLHHKAKRQLMTWSHYKFKEKLIDKVQETKDCILRIVNESFTSKTCGNCGYIKEKLGSSRIFKCYSCFHTCDRDVNGARNIWMRSMSQCIIL